MEIIPDVPVIFTHRFPEDYCNQVHGWGSFPRQVIEGNRGELLMLDIDFGNQCSLNCPHCFRRDNKVDDSKNKALGYDDVVGIIKEAKKLGLRAVKFLGAGEPLEDGRFLEMLRFLKKSGTDSSFFTKGHVIGDDRLAKEVYHDEGVSSGADLAGEIGRAGCGVLLGFNSFDSAIQDRMVGGVKGYTLKRNKALMLLARAGLNSTNPTRLCLAMNPVTNENYDDILRMYKWARERNMYPIVCPTMISGRCRNPDEWARITPPAAHLIDLYTKIYRYNMEKGIQTLSQIEEEGVSAYAGGHPCNQIACGMYVTLTGDVLRCPGDDVTVFGNVRDHSLKEIWEGSENFRRSGTFNCGCPPKTGKSLPSNLHSEVMRNLGRRLK